MEIDTPRNVDCLFIFISNMSYQPPQWCIKTDVLDDLVRAFCNNFARTEKPLEIEEIIEFYPEYIGKEKLVSSLQKDVIREIHPDRIWWRYDQMKKEGIKQEDMGKRINEKISSSPKIVDLLHKDTTWEELVSSSQQSRVERELERKSQIILKVQKVCTTDMISKYEEQYTWLVVLECKTKWDMWKEKNEDDIQIWGLVIWLIVVVVLLFKFIGFLFKSLIKKITKIVKDVWKDDK